MNPRLLLDKIIEFMCGVPRMKPTVLNACLPVQRKVSVMIWSCVTWHGVGNLCKVNGNINAVKYQEILENNLWPVLTRHFLNRPYRFQDDNAPVHRARIIEEYKRNNHINCITWPAQSPDLNIIENIWLRIKRELQNTAQTSTPQMNFFMQFMTCGFPTNNNISRTCTTQFHDE